MSYPVRDFPVHATGVIEVIMSEPTGRDLIQRFIDEIWNRSKYELLDELAALPTPASPALFAYRGPDGSAPI